MLRFGVVGQNSRFNKDDTVKGHFDDAPSQSDNLKHLPVGLQVFENVSSGPIPLAHRLIGISAFLKDWLRNQRKAADIIRHHSGALRLRPDGVARSSIPPSRGGDPRSNRGRGILSQLPSVSFWITDIGSFVPAGVDPAFSRSCKVLVIMRSLRKIVKFPWLEPFALKGPSLTTMLRISHMRQLRI